MPIMEALARRWRNAGNTLGSSELNPKLRPEPPLPIVIDVLIIKNQRAAL